MIDTSDDTNRIRHIIIIWDTSDNSTNEDTSNNNNNTVTSDYNNNVDTSDNNNREYI